MKKGQYILAACAAGLTLALASCEKDLPLYGDTQARISFYFDDQTHFSDSLVNYSFVYNRNRQQDTVWVNLKAIGFLADYDRAFEFQQIPGISGYDAVPGKHYVSFDDPQYQQLLKLPAGKVDARVPIILIQDPSLADHDYTLRFTIKANDEFVAGYTRESTRVINISNTLGMPQNWNFLCNYYLGPYGTVKHQFMIDASGEKWDDDYLLNVVQVKNYANQFYLRFLTNKLSKALAALNEQREAEGLGLLSEADGTPVAFNF